MGLLILMRGVPGTGKSFQANILSGGDPSKVFSTDEWFAMKPGGYAVNWSVEKLFPAHRWNQERVKKAIAEGQPLVIVDNTNLKMRDARVYYDMAVAAGYEVRIEESQSPWWVEIKKLLADPKANELELRKWAGKLAHGFQHEDLWIKNDHNVPGDTILNMLLKYHAYTVEDMKSS